MKTAFSTMLAAAVLSAVSAFAQAAPGTREDNSTMVIWAFLGFCALIVVAQVIPAIRHARRVAAEEKERAAAGKSLMAPAREKERTTSTYR